MGHREDLLAGARKCLSEKGYARTTARDIVAASGTNLASIGYHYGSKETLLNEALMQAAGEWGDALSPVLGGDRFAAAVTKIVALFGEHRESVAATFELLAQVDHVPSVREAQTVELGKVRDTLGRAFAGPDPAEISAVGSFCQALIIGVMAQWLIDPEHAPSGTELAEALRIIADGRQDA